MDSEKAKAGLGTCPEKVVDSEKVKARLGTLTGAEAAELRKIVVDLARVESGMAKAGPGDPWTQKPRKKYSYSCGQPYRKLCKRYCISICTLSSASIDDVTNRASHIPQGLRDPSYQLSIDQSKASLRSSPPHVRYGWNMPHLAETEKHSLARGFEHGVHGLLIVIRNIWS